MADEENTGALGDALKEAAAAAATETPAKASVDTKDTAAAAPTPEEPVAVAEPKIDAQGRATRPASGRTPLLASGSSRAAVN